MQRSARGIWAALATACACAGASVLLAATPASAQIAYSACPETSDFACGHLTVPLDPTGQAPGTITLAIRRHRSVVGDAHSAIVALAGGPGQPALPFAEDFDELLGPIASTRDLIAFDQRGIGLSDPLSCHAFETPSLYRSFGAYIAACAGQMGPNRSFYATTDTVGDIEAIRQAGGYEKLVLYGTSYGTKVAEEYAQQYPSHVEALVLDSVVTPNGPEPLERPTFAAVPRILRQLCAEHACAHVTEDPVADLARVVARTQHGPLRGRAIDGEGKPHTLSINPRELIGVLLAGDFSSLLRAEFLTTIAAAARGDDAPLARLFLTAGSVEGEGSEDFDSPLYFATTCEDQDFPFDRTATPKQRLLEAVNAALADGASAFAPFTAGTALQLSDIPACAYWPYTSAATAPSQAPLPNVPTLILSGADDLRTPTSGAREVAAQIPDAHLLVVPYTGHSVLTDEPTPCAIKALRAMFASKPVNACKPEPVPAELRPAPLPPTRLALVAATHGYSGVRGRTLDAVGLTLRDFARQLVLSLTLDGALETLAPPPLQIGGLRAGWAKLLRGAVVLHDYSYVPGVTVSGTIKRGLADLRVSGAGDAHGTLHGAAQKALSGTLGGKHVVLPAGSVASAAIVGNDAQESFHPRAGGSAAGAGARRLAELIGRIEP